MKHFFTLVSVIVVVSLALGACTMVPGPGAAGQSDNEPDATEPPATEAPVDPAPTEPGIVPIDLAGPPMEVGSFYTYVDGAILAAVPAGPFTMGFNNYFDSKEHEVTLSDYWIYTNEVTNDQYALCVNAGLCTPPDPVDNPNFDNYRFVGHPVVGVDHQQATDYCAFVHGRLPTEAEWEKAARGEVSNPFPWGDAAPECSLLNFNFCRGKVIDVKSYPEGVSYYGLFDMSGNVKEWTADYYKPDYDLASSTDPLGPELGDKRSVRSSSFADSSDFAFAAHRFSLRPVDHLADLGFRCVVDDPTYFGLYCEGLVLYGADVNGNPTDDVIPLPETCVQPGLTIQTNCKQTTDSYVSLNPAPLPDGATLTFSDPSLCTGGPPTWQCNGSGSATVDPKVCVVPPPPGGGSCAPGYVEAADPNDPSKKICTGQGLGEACLPGFTFNPLTQCCSADNPGANAYGICQPGFYQQGNACVPAGSSPPPLSQVTVSWSPVRLCPNTSGGDDDTCVPTCVIDPSSGAQICTGCP
jgi:formylglycine-generating enzyme required for sulfatase activity